MVCYHFPPSSEVGGIRPAKFAKYLPEFGWQPYVLTIPEDGLSPQDQSRLKDVTHVEIHRASEWPTILELGVRSKQWVSRFFPRQGTNLPTFPSSRLKTTGGVDAISSPSTATLKRILNSLFEFPDRYVGWLPPAVWKGYGLIRKSGISAIYATAPPTTPAVVAYLLSLLTMRPLIIDLRDPWILQEVKPSHARCRLSDTLDEWLERRMTVRARAVISATSHYTEHLRKRYPSLLPDRFLTIHNGFDPPDFPLLEPQAASCKKLTMTYVGTFYLGRTPRQLLEALGNLVRERVIDPSTIQVRLIGDVRHAEGDVVEELIRRNGLNGCVHVSDPVPYQEALREVQQADVLLLFAPRQYFSIPGKAFEYLAAQKYILCFGQDGATADLVRTTGSGTALDPYDVPAIASAVESIYRTWRTTGRLVRESDTQPFQRRELTRRLASLLDSYCDASPRQQSPRDPAPNPNRNQ